MASEAQIAANRLNARKSTGPKTPTGKLRSRGNAVTHSLTARTVMTVLPHEDHKILEARIQRALTAGKPSNDEEADLICRIERQKWEIDRADRVATAHLAYRVRMAALFGPENVSADELERVQALASKLFFQFDVAMGHPDSTGDDHPAVIVRRLEESAQGCRWLLARWAELRNLLDRKAVWSHPEILRFIGLQGKRFIEAHFDPELNSLFQAFDVLGNRIGCNFWDTWRKGLPMGLKGGFPFASYRGIADAPANEHEARLLIGTVAQRHIGRLNELLEIHKAIEAKEATERYDRAMLDTSPAFERHRRHQSALQRELMKLLDALRKLRAEPSEEGVASDEWRVASEDGVASEEGVASGQWSVASEEGQSAETAPDVSECPLMEQDSNLVLDDSTNDTIGISSRERSAPIERPAELKTRENVQNEANLASTQSSLPVQVEVSAPEMGRKKRSQIASAMLFLRTAMMPGLVGAMAGGT